MTQSPESAKVTHTETTEVETDQPSEQKPEGNPDGETDSDD